MKESILRFLTKNKSILAYLFFGVLTTLINMVVFRLFFRHLLPGNLLVGNIVAWVLAVSFAYVTNRRWVFESKVSGGAAIAKECASFFASRVVTLLVDTALLALMLDVFKWNDMFAKLVSNVVVVILNYILSKLLVFRKNSGQAKPNQGKRQLR